MKDKKNAKRIQFNDAIRKEFTRRSFAGTDAIRYTRLFMQNKPNFSPPPVIARSEATRQSQSHHLLNSHPKAVHDQRLKSHDYLCKTNPISTGQRRIMQNKPNFKQREKIYEKCKTNPICTQAAISAYAVKTYENEPQEQA